MLKSGFGLLLTWTNNAIQYSSTQYIHSMSFSMLARLAFGVLDQSSTRIKIGGPSSSLKELNSCKKISNYKV